jgi:hypothetical protein
MKLRLSILLLAAALAASPAAGQTIKSLGYNTTNGNIVAATNVTFTNSVGFATNAQSETRTNLGLGATWLTNNNVTNFRAAIGLGTTNTVTFGSLQLQGSGSLAIGGMNLTAPDSGVDLAVLRTGATNMVLTTNGLVLHVGSYSFSSGNTTGAAITRTNLGGTTVGNAVFTATNAASAATTIGLGTTNSPTFSNLTLNGTLGVSNAATFSTNVTVTGNATLNGVGNIAPSQTADSGSSLMTRDLSDARFPPMPLLSHWAPLRSVPTQLFTNNSGTISGTSVASSYATVTANTDSSVCAIFQGSAFSVLNDSLYPVDGAGNGIVFRGQLTPDGTNRLGRFLFSSAASRSDFNTAITNVGTNGIAANGWAVETRILSSGDKEMRLIVYNATAGVTNISESAWTTMASGSRYNQIIAVVPGTNTTKLYYTNGFASRLGTNPAITVSNTPAGSKLGTAGAFGFALVSIGAGGAADLFVKDIYQFVGANEFGF